MLKVIKDSTSREVRLAKLHLESAKTNLSLAERRVSAAIKQDNCDHHFELDCSAGAMGGYDMDVCTKCGYEHCY